MKQRLYILLICLTFLTFQKSFSQSFLLHTDFYQIFDNREYFSVYGHPQTIFGARLNTILGCRIDSNNSVHLGLNYMYEYGGKIDEVPVQVNLYYKYQDKHATAYFGSFPRQQLLNYPLMMLTDTLNYYRPNIEGAFMGYSGSWGSFNFWGDWTGRQTQTRRESFLLGVLGTLKYKFLYFDYYAYMFHHARDATDAQHIRDNGVEAGFLGTDISFLSPYLEKLSVDFGIVGSYDRIRPNPYVHYAGFMGRLKVHFKRLGTDVIVYKGDEQHLAYGDKLYTSANYQRVDLFIIPFKSKHVHSCFSFNLHFIDGEINTSQQISIFANFDIHKKIKLSTTDY